MSNDAVPPRSSATQDVTEPHSARFAAEFVEAERALQDWGVRSTIIVFGSARCASPEIVAALPETERTSGIAQQLAWYNAAREFSRIASLRGGAMAPRHFGRDNVIATGGGPGLMEAANRGASDVGAPSIGFNIILPVEQPHNRYATPALHFHFNYFAMRKMHLAMRAGALVVFPGAYGTLDELFEILNLQQTNRMQKVPIVLYDKAFWRRLVNFELLVEDNLVAKRDIELFEFAETPEQAWEILVARGLPLRSA